MQISGFYFKNLHMGMINKQKFLRISIFKPSYELETFEIPSMDVNISIANFCSLLAFNRVCIWNSVNASIESTQV
jgi:hypothetical protein